MPESKIIFESRSLVGYWHPRGMVIKPTAEGVEEFNEYDYTYADLGEALEGWLGAEWEWVRPESIGALTDADILSRDVIFRDDGSVELYPGGAVYAHMDYAVQDPVEMWRKGKGVVWDAAWAHPVADMYFDDQGDKVWVLDKVEFSEWNLPAHVKQMETDAVLSDWLYSVLQSNEGITDSNREVVYSGADVQDHLTKTASNPRNENPGTRKLKAKLLR